MLMAPNIDLHIWWGIPQVAVSWFEKEWIWWKYMKGLVLDLCGNCSVMAINWQHDLV